MKLIVHITVIELHHLRNMTHLEPHYGTSHLCTATATAVLQIVAISIACLPKILSTAMLNPIYHSPTNSSSTFLLTES